MPVRVERNNVLFNDENPPRSILLLRQDRIGDVLVSTPIIGELRKRYPNVRLDMLLSSNNTSVAHAIAPYTNNVIVYRKTAWSLLTCILTIRRSRFDVVVDLMDNPSTTSTILVRCSNARYTLGIDKSNAGAYSHVVRLLDRSSVHIARRIAELLTPFSINPDLVNLQPQYPVAGIEQKTMAESLGINSENNHIRLGVNASGSGKGRQYPVDKTRQVISMILNRNPNAKVYLFSDVKNVSWSKSVAQGMDVTVVNPSANFHQAAVAMRLMDILWTPDTSIVHLAAAWGTPVCVMYVHTNKALLPWYPIGTPYEALITNTTDVADIPTEQVYSAIERLFAYCDIPTGES